MLTGMMPAVVNPIGAGLVAAFFIPYKSMIDDFHGTKLAAQQGTIQVALQQGKSVTSKTLLKSLRSKLASEVRTQRQTVAEARNKVRDAAVELKTARNQLRQNETALTELSSRLR